MAILDSYGLYFFPIPLLLVGFKFHTSFDLIYLWILYIIKNYVAEKVRVLLFLNNFVERKHFN